MANKGKKMKTTVLHDDWLMAQLADAEFAAEYLNAASEDDCPRRLNIDPPCRFNIDPGRIAAF
jgi:hypothetical protein